MIVGSFLIHILWKDRNILEYKRISAIAIMLTFDYGMPRHFVLAPATMSLSSLSSLGAIT
jgi:hypothetical protein